MLVSYWLGHIFPHLIMAAPRLCTFAVGRYLHCIGCLHTTDITWLSLAKITRSRHSCAHCVHTQSAFRAGAPQTLVRIDESSNPTMLPVMLIILSANRRIDRFGVQRLRYAFVGTRSGELYCALPVLSFQAACDSLEFLLIRLIMGEWYEPRYN